MAIDYMLGIALLLAPALAEFAKLRGKAEKGFAWIGAAGVMILLAYVFSAVTIGYDLSIGTTIFGALGLISALVGTIFVAMNLLK